MSSHLSGTNTEVAYTLLAFLFESLSVVDGLFSLMSIKLFPFGRLSGVNKLLPPCDEPLIINTCQSHHDNYFKSIINYFKFLGFVCFSFFQTFSTQFAFFFLFVLFFFYKQNLISQNYN